MLPDRVSNPGPLTYKSGALPIALRGPAGKAEEALDNIKNSTLTAWFKINSECSEQDLYHTIYFQNTSHGILPLVNGNQENQEMPLDDCIKQTHLKEVAFI